MNYSLSKSAKIALSKSIFNAKNPPIFFQKKKFVQEYQIRGPIFLRNIFFNSIFDELTFLAGFFFLVPMLILGQRSYFLGPTIFDIPQPN